MNLKKPVYLIILFWGLIILIAILGNELILKTGKTVYLKTIPIDPRDILMGDYVVLNYEIAQIPILKKHDYKLNEEVYVTLNVDNNKLATAKNIVKDMPDDNQLYLKGKVAQCQATNIIFNSGRCVKFGIESYYVKEGKGYELEKNLRKDMLVEIAINKNGRAKIKGFK